MRIPKSAPLSIMLGMLGFGLAMYEAIAYTGLYRIAAELQQRWLGFSFVLLSMAPSLIYMIPSQLVAPDWDARRAKAEGLQLAIEDDFDDYDALEAYRQGRNARRLILYWIPAATLLTAAIFFRQQHLANAPVMAPVEVDIGRIGSATPPLDVPVTLVGIPVEGADVVIERRGKDSADEHTLPIVAKAGESAPPYRYFVYLGRQEAESAAALAALRGSGRITGTLSQDGLDGQVRAVYEREGVAIAQPHYLLRRLPERPQSPFGLTWTFAGITGLLILVWLNFLRRVRKHRRALIE